MLKKYFQCILFALICSIGHGQNAVLCPKLTEVIGIPDIYNVPTLNDNGDGTVTLISSEQYITDIFANHTVFGFFQIYPNSSPALQQYYALVYQEKDLVNELNDLVPEEIFSMEHDFEYTPISPSLIDFLDGKTFLMTHYCSIADNSGEECPELEVPEDVLISVTFNYDALNDMIEMESNGLTACGNSFSIGLKGGTVPNTLQLWRSIPGIITVTDYDNPCQSIEEHLFSMLDIACQGINYGDLIPTINTEDNILFLFRQNMVFGYHTATFVAENLSVAEFPLENIKVFQLEGNPYLQLSKVQNEIAIEIFAVSGTKVLNQTRFIPNQISIDNFANGLYFVRLTDQNERSRTIKFLKR